ncbi:MAG: CDP-diacylglycerol--serine O-phosphatidyltransferase [Opitutae bacterium]|nr:CDP-diacylglycerol--serine O-phosphatidyltransferase [Opitutae bacterium]
MAHHASPHSGSGRSDLENREDPYSVTQASRIYFLPNFMTALNLFCGFMAVICCIQARLAETAVTQMYQGLTVADYYRWAVYLIFAAAVCDSLDGRLARLGGRESLFGAEFDSLADVISFGIAPSLMMCFLILSPSQGIPWFRVIGWIVGFIYLLCAAMRLARFNVITNPLLHRSHKEISKDFVGLPVPAAAGTVAAMVLFLLHFADTAKSLNRFALVLPFLMLLIAILMMSTIRYPSGKNVDLQTRTQFRTFAAVLVFFALLFFFKEIGLLCICLGYIFFGLVRHLRRPPQSHPANRPANSL